MGPLAKREPVMRVASPHGGAWHGIRTAHSPYPLSRGRERGSAISACLLVVCGIVWAVQALKSRRQRGLLAECVCADQGRLTRFAIQALRFHPELARAADAELGMPILQNQN